MKLCGCVHWCRIGWLVVLLNLLFLPSFTYSQNLPPVLDMGVSNQHAEVGSAFTYTIPSNAFQDENGDPISYSVNTLPAGLAFNSSTREISGTPTNTGNTTITLTATDGTFNRNTTFRITVHPSGATYAAFTMNTQMGCNYRQVNFTSQSNGASTYHWSLGNGNTADAVANPQAIYSRPGDYTVTLTINQGEPTESSYSETIKIYPNPLADIADATNPGCEPANIQLSSTSGSGYEAGRTVNGQVIGAISGGNLVYDYWYFFEQHPAEYNTNPPNISLTSLQGGQYKVLLEVTDENGCQGTKIRNNLFEVYAKPAAFFTYDKSDNCSPSQTTFFDESFVDYSTIQSSNWTVNGVSLPDHNDTVSYDFSAYGSFPVELQSVSAYGCTSEAYYDTVRFNSNNVADFDLPTTGCIGDTLNLSANTSAGALGYAWDVDANGSIEGTSATIDYAFTIPGQHSIKLTVDFSDDCQLSVVKYINIDELTADYNYSAQFDCSNNNYPVTFTDNSLSFLNRNITSRQWYWVDGETETLIGTGAILNHTFAASGAKTVKLKVSSTDGCTSSVTRQVNLQQPSVSISISGATRGCLPAGATNFEATFSSLFETASAYNWNFGDGNTGSGQAVSHTYVTPGNYAVSVTVTSSSGCTYNESLNNSIQLANPPTISAVSLVQDPNQCFSAGVTLNTTYSFGVDHLYYQTPSGTDSIENPGGSPYSYYYEFPDTGNYTIEVVASQYGCQSTPYTASNIIANEPRADFNPQQTTFCDNPPYNATFVNTSSYSDPATEFYWDFGDGEFSTDASPTHEYNATGDFTVSLTLTNPNTGCSDVHSEQIHIYSFDNSPGIIAANITSGCAPLVVNFSQNIASRLSANYTPSGYEWDFNNDGTIDSVTTSPTIQHTYTNPGEYSVRLVVTSEVGCDYEFTEASMISASGPVANFTWSPVQACLNADVQFTNTSTKLAFDTADPANDTYTWDFGDGAASNLENPVHAYAQDTVFSVALTVSDQNNCSSTVTKADIIDIIPFEPLFEVNDSVFCNNEDILFDNLSSGTISQYRWDFDGDLNFDLTTTNTSSVTHNYASSGKYAVTLEAVAANGCSKQYTQTIRVVNATAQFSATATSIGCAPAFAYFTPATGVNDVESYSWNFGDGNSSSERSPKNFYVTPGKYTVSLSIVFKGGCSKSITRTNYITVDGAYGVFDYDQTLGCAPNPVVFSVSEMSRVNYVSWDFGTGTVQTDTLAPNTSYTETTYTYNDLGYRTPKIILTDEVCGAYAYDNESKGSIYTSTPPVANFSVDFDSICKGVAIQFTDASISNDPLYDVNAWKWNFGTSSNDSSLVQNPSYRYLNQGIYSPQLIVSNQLGCSDTLLKSNNIHIYGNDQLTSDFTISDPLACPWQELTFTSTATAGSESSISEYEWNFGSGYTVGNNQETYAFHDSLEGQTINIIHRVTDDKLCSDSTIRTVDINNLQAAFGYDPQPVFRGSLVDFEDQSTSDFGTTLTGWSWIFENGNPASSSAANPQNIGYSTIAPDNNVRLIVTNDNACKDTLQLAFDVLNNPPEVDTFTITIVENHVYQFTSNEFEIRFDDIDPGHYMDSIRIETSPNGSFTLNGNPYTIGTAIAASQISGLRFIPTPNWNGNTQFLWNANDGIDWSWSSATVYVVVLEEPDPPTLSDIVFDVPEDAVVLITKQDFIDHISSVLGSSFAFDSLIVLSDISPNVGTFTFNGTIVSAPKLILGHQIDNAAAVFEYRPTAGYNGTLSFSWNAYDGYNFAVEPAQVIINYTNTPPELTDIIRTNVKEDDPVTISKAEFSAHFSDVDIYDTPQMFYLSNLPPETEGKFWFKGQPIGPNNFSVSYDQLNEIQFFPGFGFEGTTTATWGISDGTDIGYAQIILTYVNTPPVAHDFVTDGFEDIVKTFAITDFEHPNQEYPFEDADHFDQLQRIRIESLPTEGLLSFNGSPASAGQEIARSSIPLLTYKGGLDWNGTDSFNYNAFDGTDWAANDSTVYLNIQPVNDAPRPEADYFTIEEDQTIYGYNVKANDTDVDDLMTVLQYSLEDGATAEQYGAVDLNAQGFFDYNPDQDFNGSVYFIYRVCDDDNACATDTVFINITPVNDPPLAVADTFTIYEDEVSKTFKPVANDVDVDGDYLQMTKVNDDLTGTLTTAYGDLDWVTSGNVTFTLSSGLDTLSAGETITLTFDYFITDNEYEDSSVFIIQIVGKNDPPTAVADEYTTYEGIAGISSNEPEYPTILSNDTDPEDDVLQVATVDNNTLHNITGLYGTFSWQNNGEWSFAQNLNATDSLQEGEMVETIYTYTNMDATTQSEPSFINLIVIGVNDPPVAVDNILEINEDVVSIFIATNETEALLSNDSDVDGDNFQVSTVEGSTSHSISSDVGTLQWNADGSYTYSPDPDTIQQLAADASITDIFTYTITDEFDSTATARLFVIIHGLNDAPFANDDFISVYEDTHITEIDSANGLLANDGDIDHDPIVVAVNGVGTTTLKGEYGTFTWDSTGSYVYVTDTSIIDTLYQGEKVQDVFTYTVNDPSGDTDNADLTITIIGQNDAPVAMAHTDSIWEDEISRIVGNRGEGILAEDTDIDDNQNFGIVEIDGEDVNPQQGIYGELDWNYDGTYTYTLNPEMDSLAVNEEVIDSFLYLIQDAFDSTDVAWFYMVITGQNDNPSTQADTLQVKEDDLTVSPNWTLLTNDMDTDGDFIEMISMNDENSSPTATTFADFDWDSTGTFTYNRYVYNKIINGLDTMAYDDLFVDSITYVVADEYGVTDSAKLYLEIQGVNDPPVAVGDRNSINETTPSIASTPGQAILENDYEIDRRDSLYLIDVNKETDYSTEGQFGTLEWNDDGSYVYTNRFESTDSLARFERVHDLFPYTIVDLQGATGTDTLDITIIGINDKPVALNDTVSIREDERFVEIEPDQNGILTNDYDVDGDIFTVYLSSGDTIQTMKGKYGELLLHENGQATYTLNAELDTLSQDEELVENFIYNIIDPYNGTASAKIIITITGDNDPPVAVDNFVSIDEDTDSISSPVDNANALLYNDSDIDGDLLYIPTVNDESIKPAPGNYGNLDWDSTGAYLYLTDKARADQLAYGDTAYEIFNYKVVDPFNGSDSAKLTIQIIGVNDAPVALSNAYTTFDILPVIITTDSTNDILDNDYDVDGSLSTITMINNSENDTINGTWGQLIWHPDGSFSYVPDSAYAVALRPDEVNTDQFVYTIEDEWGATDTSLLDFNITGINNGPTARTDSLIVFEDDLTAVLENGLLFNDTDPDHDTLVVTQLENDVTGIIKGLYGEVFWQQDGTIVFTPNREIIDQLGPDQTKTEVYTYTIVDEGGVTATADLIVKIIGENDPVTAIQDDATIDEDNYLIKNVVENDEDVDQNIDLSSLTIISYPEHGNASVNSASGVVYYFPDENFSGTDSILYQICDQGDPVYCDTAWLLIHVLEVNDPPVATHLILKTDINTPIDFNAFYQVTDIDDGIDPQSLDFTDSHVSQSDSILTYTPDSNFVGRDEFIYSLSDYSGATAYVIVNVLIPDEGDGAQDDYVSTNENQEVRVKILENDTLNGFVPKPLSVDIKIFPVNGVASYNPYDQEIIYQPEENYNGLDSLTYIVSSENDIWDFATVYIAVEPINSPIEVNDDAKTTLLNKALSIPVLLNDVDEDNGIDVSSLDTLSGTAHGTLEVDRVNGVIIYTPDKDYKGPDYFTYTVCDLDTINTSCNSASVFILVKTKYDDLQAVNDTVSTSENTPVDILYDYLISNDVLADGQIDFNSFTILSVPQHGSYEQEAGTNDITYTPNSNYFGPDWMTYQICDTDTSCDMAEINIWVNEVNTAPVTGDDYYVVTENTTKRLYILSNDFDYDGTLDWSTLDTLTSPSNGTISIDKLTGTILYTPEVNANTDEFNYQICDNDGNCAQGTVYITIDLGSTILYNQVTYEDTPDTIDLVPLLATFNFKDVIESYAEVIAPEIGSWQFINNNTQLVYTPVHDSVGGDYYNIILYFPEQDTADLKVTVTILPVNDAPVAVLDSLIWPSGQDSLIVTFDDLLHNDYDVDGDSIYLSETVVDFGDSLHVVFNADSTITIWADTIFWCDSWFTYEISDPSGETAIGMAFIMPAQEGIIAHTDSVSVDENSTFSENTFDVLANDLFKDNQLCTIDTIEIIHDPENGVAASTAQNTIIYQPNATYYGLDSLFYKIIDIWGQTDSAWVIIDVMERNTPPVAVDDVVVNDFGEELIIFVLDNDYDPDPDGWIDTVQTYVNIDQVPQSGTVEFNADSGYFLYKPFELSCEGDEFAYTIFDNEGDSASATVTIGLPDEAPLFAVSDTVKTYPGVAKEFNVLTNDGGYFIPSVTNFTQPFSGTVEQTGDSTFIFYPNADFAGNDSMTYMLESPCGNTAMGYVIFMVEELKVPEIITPNGDGANDVLIIDGIEYYPDSWLQIFNRYGHVVYQRKGYANDWDGHSNQGSLGGDKPLPSGTYFYSLNYNQGINKQSGFIYIHR